MTTNQEALFPADDFDTGEVERGVVATGKTDLATILEIAPEAALAKLEQTVTLLNRARPIIINATIPTDWVAMKPAGDRPPTFYLQSQGIDRIAPLVGLRFSTPHETKTIGADGHITITFIGDVSVALYGIAIRGVIGSRSTRDPFFSRRSGSTPQETEEDVRKGAFSNWRCRAASTILGLRGLTGEDLALAKFPVDRIPAVEFGTKKSTSAPPTGAPEDKISEAHAKSLWGKAYRRAEELKLEKDAAKAIISTALKAGGVENAYHVKVKDFAAVAKAIETWTGAPA